MTNPDPAGDELAAEFGRHRPVLVGAAYRVVGSVADAEDVVQETWLRWSTARLEAAQDTASAAAREEVRDVRAYLVRITTRLALNRLRQQKARREQYVGPWLPEPIAAASSGRQPTGEDPAAVAELADSVSMAMLVVLETLSPLERAAFVLREVFALPFAEIAATLDRSEPAVRQLTHRAREHVRARQPRHRVDQARHHEVTSRFLTATRSGDYADLMALLAPDVELVADGGGKRTAARRPVLGADKVARWMIGVAGNQDALGLEVRIDVLNGQPAFVAYAGDEVDSAGFLTLGADGLVTAVHVVRNPDKLTAVPRRPHQDGTAP